MTISDSYNLDAPLSFAEWRLHAAINKDYTSYSKYVQTWYNFKNKNNLNSTHALKDDYIQLIKDLSFFIKNEDQKTLLNQIDLNKDEDLLKILPYCARKLKDLTKKVNAERKNIKQHVSKIKSKGSKEEIERELRSFLLKNYNSDSQNDPTYPDLKDISNNFDIEIEELFNLNKIFLI